jgi:hypothetical protein
MVSAGAAGTLPWAATPRLAVANPRTVPASPHLPPAADLAAAVTTQHPEPVWQTLLPCLGQIVRQAWAGREQWASRSPSPPRRRRPWASRADRHDAGGV